MNLRLPDVLPVALLALAVIVAGCDSSNNGGGTTPGMSFSSGTMGNGDTFSFTVQSEGTIPYICTIHGSSMSGTIVVDAGADQSGTATVRMQNTSFIPGEIRVQPGTRITWENQDPTDHTVRSGESDTGGNSIPGY